MATPLNDLARRVFDATAWTKDLAELNSAVQPYLSGELTLDAQNAQIESARALLHKLDEEVAAKEQALSSVDTRLTLAEDARRHQIDTDLIAYRESIDSTKRQLSAEITQLKSQLDTLAAEVVAQKSALESLNSAIDEQRRTLSALKFDTAKFVEKLSNVAG